MSVYIVQETVQYVKHMVMLAIDSYIASRKVKVDCLS